MVVFRADIYGGDVLLNRIVTLVVNVGIWILKIVQKCPRPHLSME